MHRTRAQFCSENSWRGPEGPTTTSQSEVPETCAMRHRRHRIAEIKPRTTATMVNRLGIVSVGDLAHLGGELAGGGGGGDKRTNEGGGCRGQHDVHQDGGGFGTPHMEAPLPRAIRLSVRLVAHMCSRH